MKQTFKVDGMHCNHCVAHVEEAAKNLNGVEKVKVNLKKGESKIKFDEAVITPAEIEKAITDAGYPASAAQ